jgi:hypothetical protein
MIAYPKASYHTARVNACKLLKDRSIRADIEKWIEETFPNGWKTRGGS